MQSDVWLSNRILQLYKSTFLCSVLTFLWLFKFPVLRIIHTYFSICIAMRFYSWHKKGRNFMTNTGTVGRPWKTKSFKYVHLPDKKNRARIFALRNLSKEQYKKRNSVFVDIIPSPSSCRLEQAMTWLARTNVCILKLSPCWYFLSGLLFFAKTQGPTKDSRCKLQDGVQVVNPVIELGRELSWVVLS